jgi:hypothetical protein
MNGSIEEPDENSNIIRGPWKSKRVKVPDHSVFELQQDLAFIEELCESVMVQVIYTLGENGVDISDKDFLQDIAFVIESLKSTLFREHGMPHPLTTVIRHISEVTIEENDDDEDTVATKFSLNKLTKLLEKIEENDDSLA